MSKEQQFLRKLIEALQLVAADCETQINTFPDFVCVADDVMQTYSDDCFLLADQIRKAGLMTDQCFAGLKELDELFTRMVESKDEELWTNAALRSRAEWENARLRARELLDSLGVARRRPDLFWTTIVRGGQDRDHWHVSS